MNFGETLAYWYLRLNSFIPMRNFVLHRANIDGRSAADTDLLAVRFPHVYEEIGGRPNDWDNASFAAWGLNVNRKLAFIIEVKTGAVGREIRGGRPERLRAALLRFGMFDRGRVPEIARQLERANSVDANSWTIAKLLVTKQPSRRRYWLNLTLTDADHFIANRIREYRTPKLADRLRFPDDLMQYLAWRG
jgi:hypothetical protein